MFLLTPLIEGEKSFILVKSILRYREDKPIFPKGKFMFLEPDWQENIIFA
jgi:hypothetical protein